MINLQEKTLPMWKMEDTEWEYLGTFLYKSVMNYDRVYDLYYRKSIIGEHLLVKYGEGTQDHHMTSIPTKYKFSDPFPPMAAAFELYKRKYVKDGE